MRSQVAVGQLSLTATLHQLLSKPRLQTQLSTTTQPQHDEVCCRVQFTEDTCKIPPVAQPSTKPCSRFCCRRDQRARCSCVPATLHSMPRLLGTVLCHPSEGHKSTKLQGPERQKRISSPQAGASCDNGGERKYLGTISNTRAITRWRQPPQPMGTTLTSDFSGAAAGRWNMPPCSAQ